MASVLSPRNLTLDRQSESYRARAKRAAADTGLAVALALPLIFLAVWADHQGFISASPVWIANRAHVAAQGPGFTRLQYVYPPLPVLLSMVLGGRPLSLAIVTCLFSGATLAILLRRIKLSRALVVLLPLICVPAMWYTASQLLPQVVALTFLAVALQGFIQFAAYGETYGGFIAGLSLAVSYAADPGALLYAGVMCLIVPLISAENFRGDREAPIGVCAVIVFPCVAMAACWSFLIWKFTGDWPGNLAYAPNAHVLVLPGGVLPELRHAIWSALADVSRAVLYLATGVLISLRWRRHAVAAALTLPVAGLAIVLWLGFDYSPVTAYFMFTLLAVPVILQFKLMNSSWCRWALVAAAVIQVIVAAVVWPPASAGFGEWQHAVFGTVLTP